jgi:hypothetical protein
MEGTSRVQGECNFLLLCVLLNIDTVFLATERAGKKCYVGKYAL